MCCHGNHVDLCSELYSNCMKELFEAIGFSTVNFPKSRFLKRGTVEVGKKIGKKL